MPVTFQDVLCRDVAKLDQKRTRQSDCSAAMTKPVFDHARQFGERFVITARNKERVVAKTAAAALFLDECSGNFPFENAKCLATLGHDHRATKRRRTCCPFDIQPFEFGEELCAVGCICRAASGITGRKYTRRSAERMDFEPGVVRKNNSTVMMAGCGDCFEPGVFREGAPVFFGGRQLRRGIQISDNEFRAKRFGDLNGLVRIVGCNDERMHAG